MALCSLQPGRSLKDRLIIPLLGIYPDRTIIQKDTYTPMFIPAVLTITRTWKHPPCPLTDEWIKKMRYIETMEYYSAIKRMKFAICNSMDGPGGYYA